MWSMQLIADVGCGWLIRAIQTVNSTSFPCLFEFLFCFSAISGDVMFSLINSMSSCGTSMNASRLFSQLFTFTCDFNEIFTVLDCKKKNNANVCAIFITTNYCDRKCRIVYSWEFSWFSADWYFWMTNHFWMCIKYGSLIPYCEWSIDSSLDVMDMINWNGFKMIYCYDRVPHTSKR